MSLFSKFGLASLGRGWLARPTDGCSVDSSLCTSAFLSLFFLELAGRPLGLPMSFLASVNLGWGFFNLSTCRSDQSWQCLLRRRLGFGLVSIFLETAGGPLSSLMSFGTVSPVLHYLELTRTLHFSSVCSSLGWGLKKNLS